MTDETRAIYDATAGKWLRHIPEYARPHVPAVVSAPPVVAIVNGVAIGPGEPIRPFAEAGKCST